ncbi:uncharacterized protein RB166_011052 [Leptodactylus fuscus]|uniref:uncharacterized protein LOC142209225 n=1 Tax=Leptodactylus fuscus TaxID=238119 RepID=UPI003F4EBBFB
MKNFSLCHDNKTLIACYFLDDKTRANKHGKISIEWTEDKKQIQITFTNIKISDQQKYKLSLDAKEGNHNGAVLFSVSGVCQPEISMNKTTNELECEVESHKNSSIVWKDENGDVLSGSIKEEWQTLSRGFRLRSSLPVTKEMMNKNVSCSVSDKTTKYNLSELPDTQEVIGVTKPTDPPSPSSKNSTLSIVLVLLAVAVVAAAFGYLLKKRSLRGVPAKTEII